MNPLLTLAIAMKLILVCQNLFAQIPPAQLLPNRASKLNWPVPDDWPHGEVRYQVQRDGRVMARGVATRREIDEQKVLSIEITLDSRSVTSIFELTVQFTCKDRTHEAALHLFPKSPFADRKQFLKAANIELFDPVGNTAEVFNKHEIPFKRLRAIENISSDGSPFVIIGEGCNQFSETEFTKALINAAAEGQTVLCLQPKNPQVKFEGGNNRVVLETGAVQIDTETELPRFLEPSSRWTPNRDSESLLLGLADGKAGWPKVEIHPGKATANQKRAGKIIFTGLAVIEKHEDVPASRHILWKLLKSQINSKINERGNHETTR